MIILNKRKIKILSISPPNQCKAKQEMSGSQSQAKETQQMSPNVCDSVLAPTGQYFFFFFWGGGAFAMRKAGRIQLLYLIIYQLCFSYVFSQNDKLLLIFFCVCVKKVTKSRCLEKPVKLVQVCTDISLPPQPPGVCDPITCSARGNFCVLIAICEFLSQICLYGHICKLHHFCSSQENKFLFFQDCCCESEVVSEYCNKSLTLKKKKMLVLFSLPSKNPPLSGLQQWLCYPATIQLDISPGSNSLFKWF